MSKKCPSRNIKNCEKFYENVKFVVYITFLYIMTVLRDRDTPNS